MTPFPKKSKINYTDRVTVFLSLLLMVEMGTRWSNLPAYAIPSPLKVILVLVNSLKPDPATSDPSLLWHAFCSAAASLGGWTVAVVLGFGLAVAFDHKPSIERLLYPYVTVFQCLPKIALAPLIIMWFGTGVISKTALAAVLSFFPVFMNTLLGLKSTPREHLDIANTLGVNHRQMLLHVKIPSALPHIFVGLDIGLVFAVTGAIAGEFLVGQNGLGVQMLKYNYRMDINGAFAVLVLIGLLGVAFSSVLKSLKAILCSWCTA